MARVLGLDISTKTGMVLLDGEEHHCKSVTFKKLTGFQRIKAIELQAEFLVDVWQPDIAIIESYGYGNHFTLVDLVEIGTIFRRMLYFRGIIWYEVPPTTLKMWATGSGKADKPKMAEFVKAKWGFTHESNDIVDAYALARMGQLDIDSLLKIKGVVASK